MAANDSVSRRAFLAGSVAAGVLGPRTLVAAQTRPAPSEAAGWQIGCYTRPWDQHDYRVALDAIAEAGYRYVGLMTTKSDTHLVISMATSPEEARQVGEEVRKRKLRVASVYGGDFGVARSLKAGIEGLRTLIDRCAAVGAADLMVGGTGDEKLQDAYYKAVAESCDYAASQGMGISVKPHGGLNATGPQCRRIVEGVGKRNFRIWYDPGNIFYYSDAKLDPVDDAATVDGLVVGMSVKDYLHPKNVNVTPGTGRVNFRAVLDRLKKGGFTSGPLIVETLATGDLPTLLTEAKKARAFVESLVSS